MSGNCAAARKNSSIGSSRVNVATSVMLHSPSSVAGAGSAKRTGTSLTRVAEAPQSRSTCCMYSLVTIVVRAARENHLWTKSSGFQRVSRNAPVCASMTYDVPVSRA